MGNSWLLAGFGECARKDLPKADLLMVLGTSLQVQPFAGLVEAVSETAPRVLVNREAVGPWAWVCCHMQRWLLRQAAAASSD